MQRAQRASDNPALETAIVAANALGKPVVVYIADHGRGMEPLVVVKPASASGKYVNPWNILR